MSQYTNFDLTHSAGVAWITIESETDMNSFNQTFMDELLEMATTLPEDDDVRCLVLQGTEDVFCTGGNVTSFTDDPGFVTRVRQEASQFHDIVVQLKQGETPVVAGINGIAIGAGNALAMLSDYALMHEDAWVQYGYPGVGLPGDGSATYYLPRLIGLRKAKRMALLNERIDADEAEEMGLVTEVAEADAFDDRLEEVAHRIAEGPTQALGRIVRMFEDSYARSLPDQLARETEMMALTAESEDFAEGVAAFKEKRDPEFTGR